MLCLGLDLVGLDNHDALVHRAGFVLGCRKRWLTSGKTRRDPLGLRLFPLGLGFFRVVQRRVVIDQPRQSVGIDRDRAEHGQLGLGRAGQDGLGAFTLRGDQFLTLLMDDVDDRAPSQQILVTRVQTDVGATLARGLIAHLVTDRVPKILGDHQLMRRVPGDRRGHYHRAIRLVEDSRPPDGDLAEDRLEGEGASPLPLDAGAVFAMPPLQDQFLIGLLDKDPEEPALEFETRLMNVGLDLVGEMLVLVRHGQGHSQ